MQSMTYCVTREDKMYLLKVQQWVHDLEIVANSAMLSTDKTEVEEVLSFMEEMSRQFAECIHQHQAQKCTQPDHKLSLLVM